MHYHSLAIFGQQVTPLPLEDIPGWYLIFVVRIIAHMTCT